MQDILKSYFSKNTFVDINPGLSVYNFESEVWLVKLSRYYPLDALINMEALKSDSLMHCYITQKMK